MAFLDIFFEDFINYLRTKYEFYIYRHLVFIFGETIGGMISFLLSLIFVLISVSIPIIVLILWGNR